MSEERVATPRVNDTTPDDSTSQWDPRSRESSRQLRVASYFTWLAVAAAVAYYVVVMAFAERRAFETAVANWGRRMPVVAVLREEIAEDRAKQLAEKLQREVPGLEATLIGRREARSMLALQEPWLRQLPEMLVGELPMVVEFRHPAIFVAPRELDSFIAYVQSQPEVDFVVFNSLGHDEVVEAIGTARRHANALLLSVCVVSLLLLLIAHHHLIHRRPKLSLLPAFALAVADGALASALGYLALWGMLRWASPGELMGQIGVGLPLLAFIALTILLVLVELLHAEFPRKATHA
ncbi:MAG: hypothetical protein N2Z21_00020 [Candidatus Sumerlaeaceae bacterium]|nr:hypothetical protein [Candidatus Sumerlaeaceae bacterium]